MIHVLKIENQHYENIVKGLKDYEVRENNRNFQIGDNIVFRNVDDEERKVGTWRIKFMHTSGYGMKENFVILGIERIL